MVSTSAKLTFTSDGTYATDYNCRSTGYQITSSVPINSTFVHPTSENSFSHAVHNLCPLSNPYSTSHRADPLWHRRDSSSHPSRAMVIDSPEHALVKRARPMGRLLPVLVALRDAPPAYTHHPDYKGRAATTAPWRCRQVHVHDLREPTLVDGPRLDGCAPPY